MSIDLLLPNTHRHADNPLLAVSEHTQMFNGGLSEKVVESGSSQP